MKRSQNYLSHLLNFILHLWDKPCYDRKRKNRWEVRSTAFLPAAHVLFSLLQCPVSVGEITANIFSNGSATADFSNIYLTNHAMLRRAICSGQWKSFKLDLASDQFRVDREPRTRFTVTDSLQGGGGGNKTEGGGGVGKKRKRSSWITPSACNQRTGNVQRRFIKPIWVFRFRFDLPHRDLCPMLAASTILSLLEKKKTLHRHVHSPPFELIAFQLATSARDFGFFAVEVIFPSFSLFLSRFPLVCGLKRK